MQQGFEETRILRALIFDFRHTPLGTGIIENEMGNHAVGAMYEAAVSTLSENEIEALSQDAALAFLDKVNASVEKRYGKGSDAEFDDLLDPWEPLGKVLCKAFCPERHAEFTSLEEWPEDDDDGVLSDKWYEAAHEPFSNRYGYC